MDDLFENRNKENDAADTSDSSAFDSAVSAPESSQTPADNASYTPQFSYAAPTGGLDAGFAPQKKSKAPAIILAVLGVLILAAAAAALLNLNLIKAKLNPDGYLLSNLEKTAAVCAQNLGDTPFAGTSDESNSSFGDVSLSLNDASCGFEAYAADEYITFGLDGLSGKYYGLPTKNAASKLNEVLELGLSENELAEYDEMLEKSLENVDEALDKEKNPYAADFVKFVKTTYDSCSKIVKPQVGYAAYPFDENGSIASEITGKKDNVRIRYDMTGANLREMWSIIRTGLESDPAAKNYLMENAEFIAFLENLNYDNSENPYEDVFVGYILEQLDMSMETLDDESTMYADFFTDKNGCLSGVIIGSDDGVSTAGITISFGKNVKNSEAFNAALVEDGNSIFALACGKTGTDYKVSCYIDNGITTLTVDWNKDSGSYKLDVVSEDDYNGLTMDMKGILTSSKDSTYFTIDSMTIDDEDVDVSMTVDVKYESSFEKPASVLDVKDWSEDDIKEIKDDISQAVMDFVNELN